MAHEYFLDENDVRIIRNEIVANSGDGIKAFELSVGDIRNDEKLQEFLDGDDLDYAFDSTQGVVFTGEREVAYVILKIVR